MYSTSMKISVILGTRPEAIKLAPVIIALRKQQGFDCHVCVTAQHREMLDQVLAVFDILPDVDLNLMRPGQTLAGLTSRALEALDRYFAAWCHDQRVTEHSKAVLQAAFGGLNEPGGVLVGHRLRHY